MWATGFHLFYLPISTFADIADLKTSHNELTSHNISSHVRKLVFLQAFGGNYPRNGKISGSKTSMLTIFYILSQILSLEVNT